MRVRSLADEQVELHGRGVGGSEPDVGGRVQVGPRTTPVVDEVLGEGQVALLEKARPADAFHPVGQALPGTRVGLVGGQNLLHDGAHLGPARWVVGQAAGHHLHEGGLAAGVAVLAPNPDGQLGMLGVVDLHGRARGVAGAAANAFLLVHFQAGLAVHQRRPDGRHRAARHHRGALAHVGHQIVVDLGRLGVLDDDGDVGLAAAVDLAAAGGEVHAVGHLFLDELLVELVHQGLDGARGIGARDVAVQPALGVRNHGHRVARAAHREAVFLQGVDQRGHLGRVADHELDVAADGEAHMPFGIGVGDVAQLADGVDVHLPLRIHSHVFKFLGNDAHPLPRPLSHKWGGEFMCLGTSIEQYRPCFGKNLSIFGLAAADRGKVSACL